MSAFVSSLRSTWSKIFAILRHRPGEVETALDRSHMRYRRMALTSVASLTARAVGLLTSLVSVPLTFRYLGAERYGIWMVLTALIAAMSFADLGIGNGVINAVSEAYGKDDRKLTREYVTSAFVLLTIIAAVLAFAGFIAFPLIPWRHVFNVESASVASEGSEAFLVLFLWFIVSIPLGVVTRAQAGLQQAYWSQVIGACGNILSLLALVVVIAARGSLALLVFASTFGTILATLFNAWLLFREHPWLLPARRAYSGRSARKILKLGLMFFVLQCTITIGFTSDNIVIAQVLGAGAVAVYAVPQKLFSVVSLLVTISLGPVWPAYGEAIARGDVAWVNRVFWTSFRFVSLFVVFACAVLVFAGPWIIRVAMGKTLQVPMSLLAALGVWGVVSAVSTAVAMLLNGAGVIKGQAVIAVVASLSNLALSILLTRRFGVIGVCLGSIIAQLTIALPGSFLLIKRLFMKMKVPAVTGLR